MLDAMPTAPIPASALDIGCGIRQQRFREGLLRLGYTPAGIDLDDIAADSLADVHLLPLADSSIDLMVTNAVFEHLKQPHLAMSEVSRALSDGGMFVGSIAFCELFHISYFRHSPLAAYHLLESADLT
jgi:SAM-dependent methyltransferase